MSARTVLRPSFLLRRSRLGALVLVFAAPAALHSQASDQDAADAEVAGVVSSPTAQPIAGAQLSATPLDAGGTIAGRARGATTDATGRFRIAGLAAGRYLVRVRALGYYPGDTVLALRAGERASVALILPVSVARFERTVVTATRSATALADIPQAVTVVEREELDRQAAVAPNLADLLGNTVPGLGAGLHTMSTYGQSLRGRALAVLIDGVPLAAARSVSRDLATIDPSMIERIEVVRGATAIYGDGATGGLINIITRAPAAGAPRFETEVEATSALRGAGDGLGGRIAQGVSGRSGVVDYRLRGSLSRTGSVYDGEGDRIPADPNGQGGLADTEAWDVFGKLGASFGVHRFQFGLNHFDSRQRTDYTTDISVNALPAGTTKSRALEGLRLDEPQGGHNTIASLDWWHPAVLGSRAHAQLYYRDYLTRFSPFAWTVPFRTNPDDPASQIDSLFVSQSFVDSRRAGGRLELETPLDARGSTLVWGFDASAERTSQALTLFENQPYFDSDGLDFRTAGERGWVPEITPRSLGLFAQLGWRATDRVLLRAGVRHERTSWSADDFMTVRNYRVDGGTVDYAPVLVNLGTVVGVGGGVDLFANFSQGFSLADLGRALRDAPAGFSLGDQSIEAQRVDQWEAGARGGWGRIESSLSAFYNTSDLGATFAADLTLQRAPERVYGVEGTLDVRASDVLGFGGTMSWTEGGNDLDRNGTYKALDGFRIAPPKATAYLQHRTRPGWTNRVQLLHSGRRDAAFEDGAGYGRGIVESYTVVDLVSALALARGTVTVGVHNLLDRDYFSPASQLMMSGNASRAMAPGATLSVGYVVEY